VHYNCTVPTIGIVVHVLFENTVTAGNYLHVPQEYFPWFLQGMGIKFETNLFHWAVGHVFTEHFDRVLSEPFPELFRIYGWLCTIPTGS
jgi:hypothetical protein